MYLTFFIKDGHVYKRFDENHRERAYKHEEIDALLNKVGFNKIIKVDNYTNESIKSNTERIVYIVRK